MFCRSLCTQTYTHIFMFIYVCLISMMMAELTRPLTVRFATRHFSRLGHDEVLGSLEETLNGSDVKAIQITESTCLVSLVSRDAKESLISTGINVRDVFCDVYDVDQIVTNVTIKDAPYELSDAYILHHLNVYGDVVENSLRRGTIKGTSIETGTRYIQMVNVKNVLPSTVSLGRFKVRLFSDNKTECRTCKEVGHPFYRCPLKNNPPPKLCGRCKSTTHKTRECTNDIVCNYCNESGHKQKDCAEHKLSIAKESYGAYAFDIMEGRQADEDDAKSEALAECSTPAPISTEVTANMELTHDVRMNLDFGNDDTDDVSETQTSDKNNDKHETYNTIDTEKTVTEQKQDSEQKEATAHEIKTQVLTPSKLVSEDYVNFVLGDSNALRIHVKDPDVKNISKSGHKAADIKSLLEAADARATADNKTVKRIVVHLGTNDVSKHRSDSAQVQLEVSTALSETHKKFPQASIAFSSIVPRRGKSSVITLMNSTAKTVNEYIKKLAAREPYLSYIDNDLDIFHQGVLNRTLYEQSDTTGVHLSTKGADMLADSFQEFFNCGPTSDDDHFMTPVSSKRNHSVLSNTPPSEKQVSKTNKTVK